MDLRERKPDSSRHPWEAARADFFSEIVADLPLPSACSVLDIGAGDSWLAERLDSALPTEATTTCWDINYTDDDLANNVSTSIVRTRAEPDGEFDLVLLLDVLEHVADDQDFYARHVVPHVRRGGFVLASVPVHPLLFTAHDRMLAHERRYRVRDIRRLLESRLTPLKDGSLFTVLLPLRAAEKVLDVFRSSEPTGVGSWNAGPALGSAVRSVLSVDARLNGRLADTRIWLPGLSYWSILTRSHAQPSGETATHV